MGGAIATRSGKWEELRPYRKVTEINRRKQKKYAETDRVLVRETSSWRNQVSELRFYSRGRFSSSALPLQLFGRV